MARKKSVLVDGNNALYHYYDPLSTLERQGVPCGAVDGLLRLLQRMDETHAPEHICVMFDSKDRVTTRRVMQPSYKSDRRPTPVSLVPQFAQAKAALQKRHVNCIEWPGVEADDLIASYATQYTAAGFDVLLISNDNDFLQLVRGEDRGTTFTATATAATVATDAATDLVVATAPAAPVVELYQPSKRRYIRERSLRGRFGLDPKLLPDFHALCGHQRKHLPRVDNLTDEVAVQLLTQYGGLYPLLRQLDALEDPALCTTLKQGISAIEGSYRIVKLIDSVALPVAIEDLQRPQWT
uniref:5'-3' exonuclease domain-containing protein n=1 Tax=Peronospora matthiolae TaxID=2874970 RepID=A0AAV1VBF0_9STRA